MPSLIASGSLRYAGEDLSEGDAFEASEKDAFVLKAAGKAKDAPRRQATTKTRAMKSSGETDDAADTSAPGRYHRSDMRAQD